MSPVEYRKQTSQLTAEIFSLTFGNQYKKANLSIYQKKIKDQLDVSIAERHTEVP